MKYIQKLIQENYIPEEELPVRAGIRVIRRNNPDYGLSEDEIADRNEFIRCHLAREYELLMMLPVEAGGNDFFVSDFHITDEAYSAFNTVDFQRTLKPFDKYGYAMKKIMGRVKDFAILHSVISHEEGRENTLGRFKSLVELEFRERLFRYVDRYKAARNDDQKVSLKQKIGEMNRRILECKKIWEQFAPRDAEDIPC
jgi:hypothetical protein